MRNSKRYVGVVLTIVLSGCSFSTEAEDAVGERLTNPLSTFAAISASPTSFVLRWEPAAQTVYYRIEVAPAAAGPFNVVATVNGRVGSTVVVGFQANTRYYFRAINYDFTGGYGDIFSATTLAANDTVAPTIPTLSGNLIGCLARLSWTPASDSGGSQLAGYVLYRNGSFLQSLSAASSATDATLQLF